MCGRFTITLEASELQQELGLVSVPEDWKPRFNAAPTQNVGAVISATQRDAVWLRWGLIPSWAKNMEISSRLINARSETLVEKPSFRNAFAKRRCLILANGFYEWLRSPGRKGPSQPYHFRLADGKPFAFAGLWEIWHPQEGEPVRSCTIITTQANAIVQPVHDRMPVILSGQAMWDWLSAPDVQAAQVFLQPYPAEQMVAVPVSRVVNDATQDSPECLRSV
jgi:putative SOS response-associated peptidase YedK